LEVECGGASGGDRKEESVQVGVEAASNGAAAHAGEVAL
jgi:hypothetical protein